jgi:hypothetical protein
VELAFIDDPLGCGCSTAIKDGASRAGGSDHDSGGSDHDSGGSGDKSNAHYSHRDADPPVSELHRGEHGPRPCDRRCGDAIEFIGERQLFGSTVRGFIGDHFLCGFEVNDWSDVDNSRDPV